jgi:VWFA-related protein
VASLVSGPGPRRRVCAAAIWLSLASTIWPAQPPQPPTGQSAPEVTTRETQVSFKTKVNLVSIPVVARDAQGHAVGNLSREDFQLFDSGKLQTISRFSVEKFGETAEETAPPPSAPGAPMPATPSKPVPILPERYVAYVFDDVNTGFADLAQTREAAYRHMVTSLRPSERAAVYTTSGQGGVDFTGDRDKLHAVLFAIRPQNPIVQTTDCPPMTVFQANAIINGNDSMALGAAMSDLNNCTLQDYDADTAEWRVRNRARTILNLADRNLNIFFTTLEGVVHKLSLMSGQRTIVLVSSGFLVTADRRPDESALLERAVRANIVVNSLDARALYATLPGMDASAHTINSTMSSTPAIGSAFNGGPSQSCVNCTTLTIKQQEARDEAFANRDVMAEMAANTGGRFFENSNDLQSGFARLATAPEYLYVLGFAPQDLKLDGKYHTLKVSLPNARGVTLSARRGYYAPRYANDPTERSKEEIEEAFFSRAETGDIPVVISTQFFKTGDYQATLSVAAKIDVRQLLFRKEADRNRNDLTVVAGLFDSDGNYVTGTQKVLEMRLRDETLHGRAAPGITVRNTFNVTPGTYFVRVVVRDAEGQALAAHSSPVEIR